MTLVIVAAAVAIVVVVGAVIVWAVIDDITHERDPASGLYDDDR